MLPTLEVTQRQILSQSHLVKLNRQAAAEARAVGEEQDGGDDT